ncbi:MAG: hypothetical protein AAGN66_09170 [Acidobacteriota bacterium]
MLRHLAVALLLVSPMYAAPTASAEDGISIEALNGTFEQLDGGLQPIQQGPVTIVITSPEHRLQVFANRFKLSPHASGDGTLDAELDVRLEGWGELVAELVTGAGEPTRFEDTVTAGRQWVRAAARVKLEKAEGGYELTFLEAERPSVDIVIKSGLAKQLVDTCRAFAALPLFGGGLDCDSVAASLAVARIPYPDPGTVYLVHGELLTSEERIYFDVHAASP